MRRPRKIPFTNERVELFIEATDLTTTIKEVRRKAKKYRRCHFVVHVKDIDTFMCRKPNQWLNWNHANTIELKLSPLDIETPPNDQNPL